MDALIHFAKTGAFRIIPPEVKIGKDVFIGAGVRLDFIANGALITIDDGATITAGTTILTHDSSSYRQNRGTWVAPVKIGSGAFIGVNSIIMPGIVIGVDSIVGAGSVVVKDVGDGLVVAGNPAQVIGLSKDLHNRRLMDMNKYVNFNQNVYDNKNNLNDLLIEEMRMVALNDGGFYLINDKD